MSLDLNLVVVCGRLAAAPEVKTFDSGAVVVRALVTVRVDSPRRRIDVIPAVLWDPAPELLEELEGVGPGRRVWVCGSLQRRFWADPAGRRSRVELVAEQFNLRPVLEEVAL